MKRLLLLLILSTTVLANAQTGAEFVSVGKNLSNTAASFGLANNPGLLPKSKQFFGIYGLNRFTGTDLINGGLAYSHSLNNRAWGLSAQYAGTGYFNSTEIQGSYGMRYGENFSLGISLGWRNINTANLDANAQKNSLTGKIGGSYQIKKWIASFVIANPWNAKSELIYTQPSLHFSAGYEVNKITCISLQYRKDKSNTDALGLAVEYKAAKSLKFLASMQTGLEPFSAGIVFNNKHIVCSLGTAYHTYLGFTPAFSLSWQISEK